MSQQGGEAFQQSPELWERLISLKAHPPTPNPLLRTAVQAFKLGQRLVFPGAALTAFGFPADTVRCCWRM